MQVTLRRHRIGHDDAALVLIMAAEPRRVRDHPNPRHCGNALQIADRQRLHDRYLIHRDQPVHPGKVAVRLEAILDRSQQAVQQECDGNRKQRKWSAASGDAGWRRATGGTSSRRSAGRCWRPQPGPLDGGLRSPVLCHKVAIMYTGVCASAIGRGSTHDDRAIACFGRVWRTELRRGAGCARQYATCPAVRRLYPAIPGGRWDSEAEMDIGLQEQAAGREWDASPMICWATTSTWRRR